MNLAYIIVILIIVIIFITLCSSYIVHVQMNLDEHKEYDFVHFNTFLKEFKKYENDPDLEHGYNEKSIFLRKYDENKNRKEILHLHASIVKINDKCMIFYPLDWFKYCKWMKQFMSKSNSNRVKGLWTEKQ